MRAVTTATAAAALSIDRKSLDNLIARIDSDVVPAGRQGVERRIPVALLEDLAVAAELIGQLGIPTRSAFRLAQALLGHGPALEAGSETASFAGSLSLGSYLQLGVDLEALRSALRARLEEAIETQVRPRRGRPPRRARPSAGGDVQDI